jgi:hypothetical protein
VDILMNILIKVCFLSAFLLAITPIRFEADNCTDIILEDYFGGVEYIYDKHITKWFGVFYDPKYVDVCDENGKRLFQ